MTHSVQKPLTISSGLITPNWISRIWRTGAEEYGNVTVILDSECHEEVVVVYYCRLFLPSTSCTAASAFFLQV
jgi:hypothetical protein